MLTNDYGLLTPEAGDQVSGPMLRRLAESVDTRMLEMFARVTAGRQPQLCACQPSTTQALTSASSNTPINFGTTVVSWPGNANITTMIQFVNGGMTEGIYLVGCFLDMLTSGTITGMSLNLKLYDPRGPAFHTGYTSSNYENCSGTSGRGRELLTTSTLVEVRSVQSGVHKATLRALLAITGSGTATVQTTSRLWAWRVRELSNNA